MALIRGGVISGAHIRGSSLCVHTLVSQYQMCHLRENCLSTELRGQRSECLDLIQARKEVCIITPNGTSLADKASCTICTYKHPESKQSC